MPLRTHARTRALARDRRRSKRTSLTGGGGRLLEQGRRAAPDGRLRIDLWDDRGAGEGVELEGTRHSLTEVLATSERRPSFLSRP